MPAGDSLVSRQPRALSGLAWLRTMTRLPGYVVALRRRRRRLLAGLFLGVTALIWIGSSLPALFLGPAPPNAFIHGLMETLMLILGRIMGSGYLCVTAAATGALAFAPERRGGAMDQLVMTPAPRGAVFLGRALGTAIPLVPAVVLATVIDTVLLPVAGSAVGNARPLALLALLGVGATLGVTTCSMVVWSYSLGLVASLRSRTVTRAVVWSLVLLLGAGALEGIWYFWASLVTSAVSSVKVFLACYWVFALVRVVLAALVVWLCVRRFDELALGDEAR